MYKQSVTPQKSVVPQKPVTPQKSVGKTKPVTSQEPIQPQQTIEETENIVKNSSSKKWIIAAVVILLLIGGGVAAYFIKVNYDRKNEARQAYMEQLELSRLQEEARKKEQLEVKENAATPAPTISGSYELDGAIGEYPIIMEITIDEDSVSGSCYYKKYGPDNRLYLAGSLDGDNMELYETSSTGESTCYYYGAFVDGTYNGTYDVSNGKQFSFRLSVVE